MLADIPVLGPILFVGDAVRLRRATSWSIVLTYMIYRTRWGLRLRAAGEKPAAAGTVGINVIAIRYRALFLAGLICGLAGSYLSLATSGSFQMQMTAGKGFIGLAAMIFGALAPGRRVLRGARLRVRGRRRSRCCRSSASTSRRRSSAAFRTSSRSSSSRASSGASEGPAAAGQPYEQG